MQGMVAGVRRLADPEIFDIADEITNWVPVRGSTNGAPTRHDVVSLGESRE